MVQYETATLHAAGVMARLKTETAEQHKAAESRPFQRRLVTGDVSAADYGRWLGQMLIVHRTLEGRLRKAVAGDARIARVVKEDQYREEMIVADLADLRADLAAIACGRGTIGLTAHIERVDSMQLLGMHYVLEGSTNGNKFIARAIRRSLGLAPGRGDRYLDPYGDAQREKWASFKADMDSVGWSAPDADGIVAGAVGMFDGITALSGDLLRD